MSTRTYLAISGLIFFVVAVLHLFRIVLHWPAQLGPCTIPGWASYIGLAVAGGLALQAFRLRSAGR